MCVVLLCWYIYTHPNFTQHNSCTYEHCRAWCKSECVQLLQGENRRKEEEGSFENSDIDEKEEEEEDDDDDED